MYANKKFKTDNSYKFTLVNSERKLFIQELLIISLFKENIVELFLPIALAKQFSALPLVSCKST